MIQTIDIPWLYDRHTHVSLYAALQGCPDLAGRAPREALDLLHGLPADRVSAVTGWQRSRLALTPEQLAALPPVILVHAGLHGFALSAAAGRLLGPEARELLAHQDDPEWCERNMERALALLGQSAGLTPAKLDTFMAGLQRVGVGAAEDMLLTGGRSLRVIQESRWRGLIRCWATPTVYGRLDAEAQAAVAGLKLFTDGALGARTAALDEPFADGGDGLLLYTGPGLERTLEELQAAGKPIAIHAIGGRAVTQVLDALERLLRADRLAFPWVRMEHVQFITPADAQRARGLGVILCMQPNFSSDSEAFGDRLGPAQLRANNPFRMLIDQAGFRCGEDLIFGSDGLPHGVECALQWSLFPAHPGQRLTVDELVEGCGLAPGGRGHTLLTVDEERRKVRLLLSEA